MKTKKFGFSLTEVAISLLIVGILTAVIIPVVRNQMSKTDEYSYYLAYRTVEKLGGQIAALGDPDYGNKTSMNSVKIANNTNINKKGNSNKFFTYLIQKIVNSESALFKKIFPKAYAATRNPIPLFSESDYDAVQLMIQVCIHGVSSIVKEYNEDGSVKYYYTKSDLRCEPYSYEEVNSEGNKVTKTKSSTDITYDEIEYLYGAPSCSVTINSSLINYIMSSTAKSFCLNNVIPACKGNVGGYTYSNGTPEESYFSAHYDAEKDEEAEDISTCYIYATPAEYNNFTYNDENDYYPEAVSSGVCSSSSGYYNMKNAAPIVQTKSGNAQAQVNCKCSDGYVRSENNPRVCCHEETSEGLYYAKSSPLGSCVQCETNFNPEKNECYPKYATGYDPNSGNYNCDAGYKWNNAAYACERTNDCPTGMEFNETAKVCVPAPPLTEAERFCNLIAANWNTSSHKCDTFGGSGESKYNSNLYSKVVKADAQNALNSIKSTAGAFKSNDNPPNIIFSNGLKLWILGDRTASIPGLTYTTSNYSPGLNACVVKKDASGKNIATKDECDSAGGYFCASEYHCFGLATATTASELPDARNCCSSSVTSDADAHYSTMASSGFTVYVDINGNQGEGTLWKDVFPFYITSTGKVFPAYPLDACDGSEEYCKNQGRPSSHIGGNNAKYLPADVYYYTTGDNHKKVVAYSAVSYAEAACISGMVNGYSPYCVNLGINGDLDGGTCSTLRNPLGAHKCYVSVKRKHSFL